MARKSSIKRSDVIKAIRKLNKFASLDSIAYELGRTKLSVTNTCNSAVSAGILIRMPKNPELDVKGRSASLLGFPEWLSSEIDLPDVNGTIVSLHKTFFIANRKRRK